MPIAVHARLVVLVVTQLDASVYNQRRCKNHMAEVRAVLGYNNCESDDDIMVSVNLNLEEFGGGRFSGEEDQVHTYSLLLNLVNYLLYSIISRTGVCVQMSIKRIVKGKAL